VDLQVLLLLVSLVVAAIVETMVLRYVDSDNNRRITARYRSPVGPHGYTTQKAAFTAVVLALLVVALAAILLD
jgi:hypothetical protein